MKLSNQILTQEERRQFALEYQEESAQIQEVDQVHLLVFSLGGKHYTLDAAGLQEVLPVQLITQLPAQHQAVAGLINVRGDLLLCFDLRKLFDLSAAIPASHIIVIQDQAYRTGLCVEMIEGVTSIPRSSVQTSFEVSGGMDSRYIRGVFMGEQTPLLWLDHEAILTSCNEVLS